MNDGLVLLDKPAGCTSADVVRHVKRALPRGVKVGHLGTLDPFATGLLPLCVGEATKIAQFLNAADKSYVGVIQCGAATDTGDRTGTVTQTTPVPPFTDADLRRVERELVGEHMQVPPMYSAIKQGGVPLYRLARQGQDVSRAPRAVRIDALTLDVDGPQRIRFAVSCSKGTYVRVLAETIGAALGCAAHLLDLRRTRFGPFTIDQAVAPGDWSPERPAGWVDIRTALAHLPSRRLDAAAADAARHGKNRVLARLGRPVGSEPCVLLDPDGAVAAVVVPDGDAWRFGRVLAPTRPLLAEMPVVPTTVE